MHYGDKQHLKAQKVLITIYKSEYDDDKFSDKSTSVHVESIVEARHISTHSVCMLHFNIEHILQKEMPHLKNDVFYLVELKTDGWSWKVLKVKEMTSKMLDKNPLLGLH